MHLNPTAFTLAGSAGFSSDAASASTSTASTAAPPPSSGTIQPTTNLSIAPNAPQPSQIASAPQHLQYIFPAPGLNMFSIQPYNYPYPHQPASTLAVVSTVAGSPYVNILGQVVEMTPGGMNMNAAQRTSLAFPTLVSRPPDANATDIQNGMQFPVAQLDPSVRIAPLSPDNPDRTLHISGSLGPPRSVPGSPIMSIAGSMALPTLSSPPSSAVGDKAATTELRVVANSTRSDIHNFFAAMNPSLPVVPTPHCQPSIPVIPTITVVENSPQAPSDASLSVPVEPSTANDKTHAKSGNPVRKRPRDLLRHVIGGQTIFESVSGPFSEAQMAYIEEYYAHNFDASDINEVLAQPELLKDEVENGDDASITDAKKCDFCQSSKGERFFAGKRCLCKEGCSQSLNVAAKPLEKKRSAAKKNNASVEKKASPARVAKPRVIKKMRVEPPSRRIIPSKLLPPTVQSVAIPPPNIPALVERTVPTVAPVVSDVPPVPEEMAPRDVMGAAPLIVLVKRKPDLDTWTVTDIGTLLLSIRGLSPFEQKFTGDEIDGQALKLLVDPENNVDGEKLITEMGMPKWAAYKLKHIIRLLTATEFRSEYLYDKL
ncbi:polyhomeotic-proximal chromatin protein-like [Paramacrobiotus metropolitanus]|uniref:polyhomeotic-proximal chromatin protein-like n=1 Tax=Paramacrobiotus metropolitanus TaxID=2943436 RepID=UPI002445C2FF|nr:polyhomeotic-proximal chromatin protein-like [Paramacrobiotus metropolitanus]